MYFRGTTGHVYIGRERPRTGLRRPVWANSHEFQGDVCREEAIHRFRQDDGTSPLVGTALSWQSPFWPGIQCGCLSLKYTRWAAEETDVVEDLDSLKDILLVCDGPAHQPCHGDFIALAIPTTRSAVRAREIG